MKIKELEKRGETEVDVLLISPPDDFARYPYLGLCQMAAVLRERRISASILDSAAMRLDLRGIIQHVKTTKPRIIGISIMSMMLRFCHNLITILQESYPEGEIVVGGAHLDADFKIIAAMNVKYGFRGESEYAFADFCETLLGGGDPRELPGLIVNDGKNVIAQSAAILDDLNSLPMPAYDLLPIGRYYTPSSKMTAISYITSRGCPYNCSYCSKLQQKKYRHINASKVVEHLEYLNKEMGVQWVEFVDEMFTLKREYVLELCRQMELRGLKIKWGIGTRIDRLDEDLLVAMKSVGLQKIGFGLESGVDRVRFSINKHITNEAIINVLELCNKHRVTTIGSFILGLPGETEDDIEATIAFARKLPLNFGYFNRLIPIPNSQVFAMMVKSERIAPDVWEQFMLGKIPHPICRPDEISEEKMKLLYKKAWRANYLDLKRIWGNRRLLLGPSHLLKSISGLLKLASPRRYIK